MTDGEKRDRIVHMLERFLDARDPIPGGGEFFSGDGVVLMPRSWNSAFRELDRCLGEMRRLGKQQSVRYVNGGGVPRSMPLLTARWHVIEWWINCLVKSEPVTRTVVEKGRRRVVRDTGQRRIVYLRHKDAREVKALAGAGWLAGAFGWERVHLDAIRDACGEAVARKAA